MPRKLKTYITNLGFFELAIAAPSMKAALEAWGMTHNAFQHGFAKQTDDPTIVAATNAAPGVVLKRPVGSDDEFKENAEFPASMPTIKLLKPPPRPPKSTRAPREKATAKVEPKTEKAAILSFQKAKERRDRERAEQDKREKRDRAEKRSAMDKAKSDLQNAQAEHDVVVAKIDRDRAKLDAKEEREAKRWEAQRKKLALAVDRAGR